MLTDRKVAYNKVDVLLVGGGVMSATLGSLLSQLAPERQMLMVERQDSIATESTDAWNNAGTGHAGYCELNYTPQRNDGNIEIQRALEINAAFEVSLQYWSSLVKQQGLPAPQGFINRTPHESFVWGEKDVAFLKARHQLLKQHHLFADMLFSESPEQVAAWMPLVMQGRTLDQPMAATHVAYGADVDFGALTRHLVANLEKQQNFSLLCGQQVRSLKQQRDGRWQVSLVDTTTGKHQRVEAGFVFLGAGGAALPLLQSSGIAESRGYGGFPVSGQWLVCQNPDVVAQHGAKVYGKAPLGAPPMSVPHLDTRYIQRQPALLFGPFAGFSSKFLKQGSYLDLLRSVKSHNLSSLLGVARHHMELTRYLIGEVMQSHDDRMQALRKFYPDAVASEWRLATAGQRVQIIKRCKDQGGRLEFGTEIVASADGSLAALLGASPGASVSVQAMLNVLQRCFSKQMQTATWQANLTDLIPSYGQSLVEDAALLNRVRADTLRTLALDTAS